MPDAAALLAALPALVPAWYGLVSGVYTQSKKIPWLTILRRIYSLSGSSHMHLRLRGQRNETAVPPSFL
jgi:hypothetical protein